MPRHRLLVYTPGHRGTSDEPRDWKLIGHLDLAKDQILSEATIILPLDSDDGGGLGFMFVEDGEFPDVIIALKRLAFLSGDLPVAAQIDARNDNPARRGFNFLEDDAPIYLVRRPIEEIEPLCAHDFYVWGGRARGWIKSDTPYTDLAAPQSEVTALLEGMFFGPNGSFLNLNLATDARGTPLQDCFPTYGALEKKKQFVWESCLCFQSIPLETWVVSEALPWQGRLQPRARLTNGAIYVIASALIGEVVTINDLAALDTLEWEVDETDDEEIDGIAAPCPLTNVKPPLVKLPDYAPRKALFVLYNSKLNHDFVFDLAEACLLADGGKAASLKSSEPITGPYGVLQPQPSDHAYSELFNRAFVQDRFMMFCRLTPGNATIVEVTCPHKTRPPPASAVLAEEQLDLDGKSENSQNYGGNFLVSPPAFECPRLPALDHGMGRCGPAVPAQGPAPFGKIVVGDGFRGHQPRGLDPGLRTQLLDEGRGVQPWLPIDVSWINVGHVDEIVSFALVKGRFKMLVASPRRMEALIAALVKKADQRLCCFHVGNWALDKANGRPLTPDYNHAMCEYSEMSLETLLRAGPRLGNRRIQRAKLDPIVERLKLGLGIGDADIIEMPVYFSMLGQGAQTKAEALTINVVNMQLATPDFLVPRPYGPRLPPFMAAAVLREMGLEAEIPPVEGFWHWAFPGEEALRVAVYYVPLHVLLATNGQGLAPGIERARMAYLCGAAKDLGDPLQAAAEALLKLIRQDERNIGWDRARGFFRVWIPLPAVDVVEEYIKAALGVPPSLVHFISGWTYHKKAGDVHCGTNGTSVTPPEWCNMIGKWTFAPYKTYKP